MGLKELFNKNVKSASLVEGVHENTKIVSIDVDKRKDRNGNTIKKQVFIKFKKFDGNDENIGETEVSFFLLDSKRDQLADDLSRFVGSLISVLSVYAKEDEISSFDPITSFVKGTKISKIAALSDEELESEATFDNITNKIIKGSTAVKELESYIAKDFLSILEKYIGEDSDYVRLKLTSSKNGDYVQLPAFGGFIEHGTISKETSELYDNK